MPCFRWFMLLAVAVILLLNVRVIFNESLIPVENDFLHRPVVGASVTRQRQGQGQDEQASGDDDEEEAGEEEDETELSPSADKPTTRLDAQRRQEEDLTLHASASLMDLASKDDPDTFSCCLQIMDDNHFLIEWLAYHYFVMPMRRLIVYMDPKSRTTPQPILDRWKDRMDITLWHDEDVFPNGLPKPKNANKNVTAFGQYILRQRTFLGRCLQTLHKEKRGWVFITDTDEYTMINDRLRDPKKFTFENSFPEQSEPGSVMKLLQQGDMKHLVSDELIDTMPCITMARRTFSTKEIKNASKTYLGYTVANFQTLHWKLYDKLFKPGKALVNLRKIRYRDITSLPSVHRPISNPEICTGKLVMTDENSVFAVNHYPGTLRQMLFREDDARGITQRGNSTAYRIERFENHKKMGKLFDSYRIEEWLKGFMIAFGEAETKRLLENVGNPEEAATYVSKEATANEQ